VYVWICVNQRVSVCYYISVYLCSEYNCALGFVYDVRYCVVWLLHIEVLCSACIFYSDITYNVFASFCVYLSMYIHYNSALIYKPGDKWLLMSYVRLYILLTHFKNVQMRLFIFFKFLQKYLNYMCLYIVLLQGRV
jgi:hypothetical protein